MSVYIWVCSSLVQPRLKDICKVGNDFFFFPFGLFFFFFFSSFSVGKEKRKEKKRKEKMSILMNPTVLVSGCGGASGGEGGGVVDL